MSNNLQIGYKGTVKLTYKLGKYTLQTKTYNNSGAMPLFKFLGNCLAGNFPKAYDLRPFKIRFFKINENIAPIDCTNVNNLLQAFDNGLVESASDYFLLASAPVLTYTKDSCKVTFNFLLPYHRLTQDGANMVAFYGVSNSDNDLKNFCAYYLLTSSKELKITSDTGEDVIELQLIWDPIKLDDEDEDELNKIIGIEWAMTLKNQ